MSTMIENRIKALEAAADVISPEKEIIIVFIGENEIEISSDVFGREVHDREGRSIQDIQDELNFRFEDSPDVHFIFMCLRDDPNEG